MAKSLIDIIKTAKSKGYAIDTRPNALNIIGVRNSEATNQNVFDDQIAYFYYDNQGKLVGDVAKGTTDPSTFWLKSPILKEQGTAILKSGQYPNAYAIGLHRGKYEALVQTGAKVDVIRDNDRDSYINYLAPIKSGYFGINIHRATRGKQDVAVIDKDSAGCQVFQNEDDYNKMMQLARIHKNKYGNNFTYTLIDERDIIKVANTLGLGILLIVIAFITYQKFA
jgi:hypothetical protein